MEIQNSQSCYINKESRNPEYFFVYGKTNFRHSNLNLQYEYLYIYLIILVNNKFMVIASI